MPLGRRPRRQRSPLQRRQRRGGLFSAALGILGLATAVLIAALLTGRPTVVAAAGVVSLLAGWVAFRLTWTGVLRARLQHATERTDLARAYRDLFAARAVEATRFSRTMGVRLADRERAVRRLREESTQVERRAVEAETSARTFQRRLTEATDQLGVMEELITRQLEQQERQAAQERELEDARRSKPPLRGGRRAGPRQPETVPEWAQLEPDPVAALMAWEERADEHAAREAEGYRHRADGTRGA